MPVPTLSCRALLPSPPATIDDAASPRRCCWMRRHRPSRTGGRPAGCSHQCDQNKSPTSVQLSAAHVAPAGAGWLGRPTSSHAHHLLTVMVEAEPLRVGTGRSGANDPTIADPYRAVAPARDRRRAAPSPSPPRHCQRTRRPRRRRAPTACSRICGGRTRRSGAASTA